MLQLFIRFLNYVNSLNLLSFQETLQYEGATEKVYGSTVSFRGALKVRSAIPQVEITRCYFIDNFSISFSTCYVSTTLFPW